MRRPRLLGLVGRHRLEVVFHGQPGEGAVDQLAGGFGVDVADDRNGELVAREHATHVVAQIGGGDARHRFQRALAFAAIGVAGKGGAPPTAAGETVRIGGIAPQARQLLPAHALDRIGIEARLGQRQVQKIEGLVAVLVEGAQRAAEIIAADPEAEVDGVVFQPLVIGLAVEVAGALVDQVGGEIGGAALGRVVLAGAAVEGVTERHQRNRALAHQPGGDAGGADDLLDRHRRGRRRDGKKCQQGERDRTKKPRHDRFSTCGRVSLIR